MEASVWGLLLIVGYGYCGWLVTVLVKTLDTFVYCQRPVFSLGVYIEQGGVSQHYAQNYKPVKIWTQLALELRDNIGWETPLSHTRSCVHSDAWLRDLKIKFWGLEINFKYFSGKLFFLENYVASEGAVSHSVLYSQQLSVDR